MNQLEQLFSDMQKLQNQNAAYSITSFNLVSQLLIALKHSGTISSRQCDEMIDRLAEQLPPVHEIQTQMLALLQELKLQLSDANDANTPVNNSGKP